MNDHALQLLHRSMKLISTGDGKEAEVILRELLKTQQYNADVWWLLGKSLSLQNRLKENVEAFRRAVELKPKRAELWSTLGVVLIRVGEILEGQNALEKAFELDNRSIDLCEFDFGKLIEENPEDPLLWYGLGIVLDILDRSNESKVVKLKAHRLGLSTILEERKNA